MGKAIPRNVLVRQGCVLTLPRGGVGQAQSRPAWLEGTRRAEAAPSRSTMNMSMNENGSWVNGGKGPIGGGRRRSLVT